MSSWVRDTYARRSTTFKRIFSFKRKSVTETSAAIPRMAQSHGNRPSAEGGSGETSDAGPSREELSPDVSSDMEPKRKRFRAFRVVRKIFRRKTKLAMSKGDADDDHQSASNLKSRSTSELLGSDRVDDDRHSGAMSGLSVSHDSVFTPDTAEDIKSSRARADLKKELARKLGARQESDDDDAGLPRSPCTSPTTNEILRQGLMMGKMGKFHSSDASLLSMGSSETDNEDGRDSSGSRLLLPRIQGSDPDLDVGATVLLDNHAALHKLSVKPRRTHAVPLNRRVQQVTTVVSLPTTPEDTENMVVPVVKPRPSPRTLPSKSQTPADRLPPQAITRQDLPLEVGSTTSRPSEGQINVEQSVVRRTSLKQMNVSRDSENSQDNGGSIVFHSPEYAGSPASDDSGDLASCFNLGLISTNKNSISHGDVKTTQDIAEDKGDMSAWKDAHTTEIKMKMEALKSQIPTFTGSSYSSDHEPDKRDSSVSSYASRQSFSGPTAEQMRGAADTDGRSGSETGVASEPVIRTSSIRRSNNIARLSQHFEKSPLDNPSGGEGRNRTDSNSSVNTHLGVAEITRGKLEAERVHCTTNEKNVSDVIALKTAEQVSALQQQQDVGFSRPTRTDGQIPAHNRREVLADNLADGLTQSNLRKGVIVDSVMVVGEKIVYDSKAYVRESLLLRTAIGVPESSTRNSAATEDGFLAESGKDVINVTATMNSSVTSRVTHSTIRRNPPVHEGLNVTGQQTSEKTKSAAPNEDGSLSESVKRVDENVPVSDTSLRTNRVTPSTIRRKPPVHEGKTVTGEQANDKKGMAGDGSLTKGSLRINAVTPLYIRKAPVEDKGMDVVDVVGSTNGDDKENPVTLNSLRPSEELGSPTKIITTGKDLATSSIALDTNTDVTHSQISLRNHGPQNGVNGTVRLKTANNGESPPSNVTIEPVMRNGTGDPSREKRQSVHQQLSEQDINELEEFGKSLPASVLQDSNQRRAVDFCINVAKDSYPNAGSVILRTGILTPKSPDKEFTSAPLKSPTNESPSPQPTQKTVSTITIVDKVADKKPMITGEPQDRRVTPINVRPYGIEVSGHNKFQSPSSIIRPDVQMNSQLTKSGSSVVTQPFSRTPVPSVHALSKQKEEGSVSVKETKEIITSAQPAPKGSEIGGSHPSGINLHGRKDWRVSTPVNASNGVSKASETPELLAAFRKRESSKDSLLQGPKAADTSSKERQSATTTGSRRHSVHVVDPSAVVSTVTSSSRPVAPFSAKEVIHLSPPPQIRAAASSKTLQGSAPLSSKQISNATSSSPPSHTVAGNSSLSKQGPQASHQSSSRQGLHGSPSSSPKQSLQGSPSQSPKQVLPGVEPSSPKQFFQGVTSTSPKQMSQGPSSLPSKQSSHTPSSSSPVQGLGVQTSQQLTRHGSASSLVRQEGLVASSPPQQTRNQIASSSLLPSKVGDSRPILRVTLTGRSMTPQQPDAVHRSQTPERRQSDPDELQSSNKGSTPTHVLRPLSENRVPVWQGQSRGLERTLPPNSDVSNSLKDIKKISDPSKIIISSLSKSEGGEKTSAAMVIVSKPVPPLGVSDSLDKGRSKSLSESERSATSTSITSSSWKSGLPDSASSHKPSASSQKPSPSVDARTEFRRKASVGNGGPRVGIVIIDDSNKKTGLQQVPPNDKPKDPDVGTAATSSRAFFQGNTQNVAPRVSLPNLTPKGIVHDNTTLKGTSDQRVASSIEIVDKDHEKTEKTIDTPQWMKMAQQRRDQRKSQSVVPRGQSEPVPDVETVPKPAPGRSSRVLDMVSNLQKQVV